MSIPLKTAVNVGIGEETFHHLGTLERVFDKAPKESIRGQCEKGFRT